jgi:hypothetical protein
LFDIFRDRFGPAGAISTHDSDHGFAGDVLSTFRIPATGDVAAVWRVRFDDADRAAALTSFLRSDPSLTVSTIDRDVILFADTRGAPSADFVNALEWEPAPAEDVWPSREEVSADPRSDAIFCSRERFDF